MATTYRYRLNDGGISLILVDEVGPLNTWSSQPQNNCLLVETGAVDAEPGGLICRSASSGYDPVVTLRDASWDSEVGDSGEAVAHLATGCAPSRWTLVAKD